jgi:hypothetical protein
MISDAKYIIWDDGLAECAIVFNNHLTHADMALQLNINPISAGFVKFDGNEIMAFGESVSLQLKSRQEDSRIIREILSPND